MRSTPNDSRDYEKWARLDYSEDDIERAEAEIERKIEAELERPLFEREET